MAWTDETREQAVEMYLERNPTPENTLDIIKEIAEELGETANGVRMLLSRREVYVKAASKAGGAKKEGSSTPRVSKADSLAALTEVIQATGADVDDDILSKLTGKQAIYFTSVIKAVLDND